MNKNLFLATLLCVLGSVQILGDLLNLPEVKAIGLITHASPAPKVFTAHKGFETFSSRFYIRSDSQAEFTELTAQMYAQVQGPYNRRNAYGATLSYGPLLYNNPDTRSMFSSVAIYALCSPGNLAKELGWTPDKQTNFIIRLVPRDTKSALEADALEWRILCSDGSVVSISQQEYQNNSNQQEDINE
jgi:hypothetical protein